MKEKGMKNMRYTELPKGSHDYAMPQGSLNSGGGHDPQTKRLEKHSVKDKWFTTKKPKGDA